MGMMNFLIPQFHLSRRARRLRPTLLGSKIKTGAAPQFIYQMCIELRVADKMKDCIYAHAKRTGGTQRR